MAAAVPVRRESPWTLVDLVGVETLQAIQDAFASAFDLPTVILDHEGQNVNEITYRVTFCEDLTRPSSAGHRCLGCDLAAMRQSEMTGEPTIFPCWNGLYDCTIPIVSSDGEVFGHFLSGQVIDSPPTHFDRWRSVAREHDIDEEAYVDALREVRVLPLEIYRHRVECMAILARMIADQASTALQHRRMLQDALDARDATQRLAGELDAITGASLATVDGADLDETLARLADTTARVIPHDSLLIHALAADGRLTPVVVRDPHAAALASWRPALGEGIVGRAAGDRLARRIDVASADPAYVAVPGDPGEPEAVLVVPIVDGEEVRGVITLSRIEHLTFTAHELDLLRLLATQAATAIRTHAARQNAALARDVRAIRRAADLRLAAGTRPSEIHSWLSEQALRLLRLESVAAIGADDAVSRAPGGSARGVSGRLVSELVERARTTGRASDAVDRGLHVLAIPSGADGSACLLLARGEPFTAVEQELAQSLASLSSALLALEREREGTARFTATVTAYAELVGRLAEATTADAAVAELLRCHRLLGGSWSAVVLRTSLSGLLRLYTPDQAGVAEDAVVTSGRPRLRLPDGGDGSDPAWETWARALVATARPGQAPANLICVPFRDAAVAGAVVIEAAFPVGGAERRLLDSLARVVGARLSGAAPTPVDQRAAADVDDLIYGVAACEATTQRAAAEAVLHAYAAINVVEEALIEIDGAVLAAIGRRRRSWPIALQVGPASIRAPGAGGKAAGHALQRLARAGAAALRRSALREREADARRRLQARADADARALAAAEHANASAVRLAAGLVAPDPLTALAEAAAIEHDAPVELRDSDGRLLARVGDPTVEPIVVRAARRPADASGADASGALLQTLALAALESRQSHDDLEDRLHAELLHALVDADRPSPELDARIAGGTRGLDRPVRIAVALPDRPDEAELGAALSAVLGWARAEPAPRIVARRDDAVVVIGPAESSWPQTLHGVVSSAIGAREVYVGVGREAHAIPAYRDSYLAARAAAHAMAAAGREGVVVSGDDSVAAVILQSADPERLVSFARRILQPLAEHDARRRAALTDTLRALVAAGWNLHGAARACHVHVSTLRYRVGRIESVTGLDLTLADDRLAAQLALMTARVLGL